MARYATTIRTRLAPPEAFAYLADFSAALLGSEREPGAARR
jgi:hypothetical protein